MAAEGASERRGNMTAGEMEQKIVASVLLGPSHMCLVCKCDMHEVHAIVNATYSITICHSGRNHTRQLRFSEYILAHMYTAPPTTKVKLRTHVIANAKRILESAHHMTDNNKCITKSGHES